MLNAFANPSPKLWLVPDCSAFAIVHQGLDRVGCLCTGKFLLVGLASADNRNCQEVLAQIRVYI